MAKTDKTKDAKPKDQISIRLQPGTFEKTTERAESLAAAYTKDEGLARYGPWTRHRILRLALETGLDVLEDKAPSGGGKKRP